LEYSEVSARAGVKSYSSSGRTLVIVLDIYGLERERDASATLSINLMRTLLAYRSMIVDLMVNNTGVNFFLLN
jgi:hypothetical protein